MGIDVTADGAHAYRAEVDGVVRRVVVDEPLLDRLGLTAVEEPLLVRRTLELAADQGGLAPGEGDLALSSLGATITGFPDTVVARLRT
jgi:hypothetical protein